jgi:lysophospholipase L1-like esterase
VKYKYDRILETREIDETFGDLLDDAKTLKLVSESFHQLKEMTDEDGARLLVVIFPYFTDFESRNLQAVYEKLHELLDLQSISYVDTFTAFASQPPTHWRLTDSDTTHPNPQGHRLIADELARFVVRSSHHDASDPNE